jgi:hypothetical protein
MFLISTNSDAKLGQKWARSPIGIWNGEEKRRIKKRGSTHSR